MTRAKRGFKARRRRKNVLELAKGFRGARSKRFRTAIHVVKRALRFAYRDRRTKKREFRSLWIIRINAAARSFGLRYGEFMHGLALAGVQLDRSVLADLAARDSVSFEGLVVTARNALSKVAATAKP